MEKFKELWLMYRYQIIVGATVLFGGLLLGYHAIKPASAPETPSFSSAAGSSLATSVSTAGSSQAVQKPGVYTFKRGARVQEAIRAAGGILPNAAMKDVSLAKELADQQIIYIPTVGEQVATPETGSPANSDATAGKAPVNLNTATKEQLCQITGIDELMQVSGFGEKTVAKIKEQVAV